MTVKPSTSLVIIRTPVVDDKGLVTRNFMKWLQDTDKKVNTSLNQLGIDPGAVVGGSSGTIGSQLQHLNSNGVLQPGGVGFTVSDVPGAVTPPQVGFTLDSVPNGVVRFSVAQVDANNLAIINFASAHLNKILDNVNDGTTYQRFTRVASGQITFPMGILLSGDKTINSIAAPGVLSTDSIQWSFDSAPDGAYNNLSVLPYVTPGNVNFSVGNPSSGTVTLTVSQTINYVVIR